MENLINFGDVNQRIITIRNQSVILDADVAKLYGVETRDINKSVKNNPKKFPDGYIFQLKVNEFDALRSPTTNSEQSDNQVAVENFHRPMTISNLSRVLPMAFTEKGLYMLATILKSDRAIEATIAIVEAFAKLRQLQSTMSMLSSTDLEVIDPEIVESTGSLIKDLFFSHLPTTSSETSFEFNLGMVKGKRTIKSESSALQQELNEIKKAMEEIRRELRK